VAAAATRIAGVAVPIERAQVNVPWCGRLGSEQQRRSPGLALVPSGN
jgi:hypothetical protein